ncbi:MAG: hypothetical protein UDG94_02575 [Peptococcaceae bacterium]|nr:hypothetical protein [Peptococcaceae bacterium]
MPVAVPLPQISHFLDITKPPLASVKSYLIRIADGHGKIKSFSRKRERIYENKAIVSGKIIL